MTRFFSLIVLVAALTLGPSAQAAGIHTIVVDDDFADCPH